MPTTRQALLKIAEGPGEIPTWQVELTSTRQVAGFNLTLSGFAHGVDREEAAKKIAKEVEYLLINGGNWTPWNAAAKAEEEDFNMDFRGKPGFQSKPGSGKQPPKPGSKREPPHSQRASIGRHYR